jgi:O-methyltransferase
LNLGSRLHGLWLRGSIAFFSVLPGKPLLHRPEKSDEEFLRLMREVRPRTIVDDERCFMLFQLALAASRLPGDVAEVGVYRGGTARLLARTTAPSGKTVRLFDTFAGMPSTDPVRDSHRSGDFGDSPLDDVRAYLADCPNVSFHPGLFPPTATQFEATSFCFAHIDVDIYASVRDCCEFFYPRTVAGGVLVFDDYGFRSCPGAKQAVDDFFASRPERPWWLPTGQAVVIRAATER